MAGVEGLQPVTPAPDMLPPSSTIPLSFFASTDPVASSSSSRPPPAEPVRPLLGKSQQPPQHSSHTQPRRLTLVPFAPSFEQWLQHSGRAQQHDKGPGRAGRAPVKAKRAGKDSAFASPLPPPPTDGALTENRLLPPSREKRTATRETKRDAGLGGMVQPRQMCPGRLRETIDIRAERLRHIAPDVVHDAIARLLNAPSDAPPFGDLALLSLTFGCEPCHHSTMVDDESNPWSEYILLFIDTLLVLYRPVATTPIALIDGYDEWGGNDETDQAAFGATTATSLAARVLYLIPRAHHHVVKALWFALIYLSIAYFGSERGVAVDFLLERIDEAWAERERGANKAGRMCWSDHPSEDRVEGEWYRRAHAVEALRREHKARGGLWIRVVWAEMKGLREVRLRGETEGRARSTGEERDRASGELSSDSAKPPQRPAVETTIPSAAAYLTTPATTPPPAGFERGEDGIGFAAANRPVPG